jgi:hypothetical protein
VAEDFIILGYCATPTHNRFLNFGRNMVPFILACVKVREEEEKENMTTMKMITMKKQEEEEEEEEEKKNALSSDL